MTTRVRTPRSWPSNLGIDYRTIAIEPAHAALLDMLAPSFAGRAPDLTEENLQSRIRGMTLMALSNKFGWIVLTTGNKSEMAVGYATHLRRHGRRLRRPQGRVQDRACSGCAVCATSGPVGELIPESVITKPPSAELRPDQRDDQSLPPYDVLDEILEQYIEHDRTVADLIDAGHDAELVRRVARLVDGAEYKRRQSPTRRPGHRQGVRQGPPPPHHQRLRQGVKRRPREFGSFDGV